MKTDNKIKMFAVAATVLATAACTDTWTNIMVMKAALCPTSPFFR